MLRLQRLPEAIYIIYQTNPEPLGGTFTWINWKGRNMSDNMTPQIFFDIISELVRLCDDIDYDVYISGGSVRSILLNKPVKDLDLVVDRDKGAAQLAASLKKRFSQASEPVAFNANSNFKMRIDDFPVHISDAKEFNNTDYSSVYAPVSDRMKADALQRDFTVNTMLLHVSKPNPREIIDPLALGKADLRKRVLRTPQDAGLTFTEDPIRMLRAVRFVVTEDFELSQDIVEAISSLAPLLGSEPGERINPEFSQIITSANPEEAVTLLLNLGLLNYIVPEIEELATVRQPDSYYKDNLLSHTLKVLANSEPVLRLRLAALFHDVGKITSQKIKDGKVIFHGHQYSGSEIARKSLTHLRYPVKLIDDVCKLIEMHMIAYRKEWSDTVVRRLVNNSGELLDDLLLLYQADIMARDEPYNDTRIFEDLIERIKILDLDQVINASCPITGDRIMEILNCHEGPEVGNARAAIEQAIIDGRINEVADEAEIFLKEEYLPKMR